MLDFLAQYPGSVAFYILLLLGCCLLSHAAEESGKPYPLIADVALLTVVSAFRAPTVGVDTTSYASIYYGEIPLYFEPGFTWFIQLLKPFHSLSLFLGIIALVVYGCTFARFWQLRRYCSLTLAVAVYLLVFFPATWNGLRSCIVTAVMFYAMGLVEKQRYVPFLVSVGLCCTVHYSSVAFLLLLLAAPNWTHALSRNKRTILMLVLPIILLFVVAALLWMVSSGLFTRYGDEYGDKAAAERIGLSWYLFFVLLVAMWGMLKAESKGTEERTRSITYLLYATLGVGFMLSGLFWFGGGRLSSYFIIYSTLILARFWIVSRTYRYGMFFRAGAGVYCCYAFLQVLMSNGQGLLPYALG